MPKRKAENDDNSGTDINDRFEYQPETKKYKCKECESVISSKSYANTHYELMHTENGSVKCDVCKKSFPKTFYKDRHMKKDHGLSQKDIENSIRILIPFTDGRELFLLKNKKSMCGACDGKIMSSHGYGKTHVDLMHAPDKNLKCPYCEKIEKKQFYLDRHIKQAHAGNSGEAKEEIDKEEE